MIRRTYFALIVALGLLAPSLWPSSGTGELQATNLAQIIEVFLGHGSKPAIDFLRDWPGYSDEEDIPDRFRCSIDDVFAQARTVSKAFCHSETRLRPSRSRVGLSRAPPSA
jgi:hypothetical protein